MALVGICAVWGTPTWKIRAQRVLSVWSHFHGGARTLLIEPGRFDCPDYTKARILDHVDDGDIAVYMDADTVCTGNTESCFDPSMNIALCAHGLVKVIRTMEPRSLWFNRTYFSTGYMMVRKTAETEGLFKTWWDSRRTLCGIYSDQSVLNSIIATQGIQVSTLDPSCNYFSVQGLPPPEGTRVIHWGSVRDSYGEQSMYLTYQERAAGISTRQA